MSTAETELRALLPDLRKIVSKFAVWKVQAYPRGARVKVDCARYCGTGEVAYDVTEACPIDHLAVKLENGNVWWYPIENCEKI